jgi:hypothetical protein
MGYVKAIRADFEFGESELASQPLLSSPHRPLTPPVLAARSPSSSEWPPTSTRQIDTRRDYRSNQAALTKASLDDVNAAVKKVIDERTKDGAASPPF